MNPSKIPARHQMRLPMLGRCRDMKKYASKEDTQMFAAAEERQKIDAT
jgi:hypothetical protein